MSATFNWAYKPGVVNKYGITVPASADDVRPTGFVYVALFGNDVTGNGSRQRPYRTLAKAFTVVAFNTRVIIGSGTYREYVPAVNATGAILIGDGDVIVDGSFVGSDTAITGYSVTLYNMVFKNWPTFTTYYFKGYDCTFLNIGTLNGNSHNANGGSVLQNCVFKNCGSVAIGTSKAVACITNVTIDTCLYVEIQTATTRYYDITNLLVYKSNVYFWVRDNVSDLKVQSFCPIDYSLFYNCNVCFNATSPAAPLVYYPSTPPGYTKVDSLADLQGAQVAMNPNPPINFQACKVVDPKFNNYAIGDLTLAFDSPAKNLSYTGTFVGAKSIAYTIKARAVEADGDFDFSTNTNLLIADNSIKLNNQTIDGKITTNALGNLIKRQFRNMPIIGTQADRNGQYIDSIADKASVTISAGSTLPAAMPFIVENGAIAYNGNTMQPGERGTTVATATTFTTAAGGVIREILEAPQRHTVEARFSDGGTFIAAGAALVAGNWYYVTGTITYNAVNYTNRFFKAVDTNPFAGAGVVDLVFQDEVTNPFSHYEPGIAPTSNNVGDARLGAIIRGNGDPAYDRGGIGVKEFYINAKYFQYRFTLMANNLKP